MKKRIISVIAVFGLMLGISCTSTQPDNIIEVPEDIEQETPSKTELIIGTSGMTGDFSPFITGSGGNLDVMSVINELLVTLDRSGEVVRDAADNSANSEYSGIADIDIYLSGSGDDTTTVTFRLREDIYYSDGVNMTADDIIFTLYTLTDTDYRDKGGLSSLPIEGMEFYHVNADRDIYGKYEALALLCLEAVLAADDEDFEGGGYTDDDYEIFYECYMDAWLSHVKKIVDYCARTYADYAHIIDESGEGDLAEHEWMRVALAMFIWRTADFRVITPASDENEAVYGSFTSRITGREWNLTSSFPTIAQFFDEFVELYEGNLEAYINAERIGDDGLDNVLGEAKRLFIKRMAAEDEENTGAANISGIHRHGDYEVQVILTGHVPEAVYAFRRPVAALHYYGNMSLYNYNINSFGFIKGDLSAVREICGSGSLPLGAGAYKLESFDGQNAVLTANNHYYKGAASQDIIRFRETGEDDLVYSAATGTVDIAAVTASGLIHNELYSYMSTNAEITVQESPYDSFGYIGINAERVPDINIRKGLAVILAAYREMTVRDFFGEAANVAEYPVSGVSRAVPHEYEEGYKTAYAQDINGNDIYDEGMTEAQRIEAAKRVAAEYFNSADEDARYNYEIYITGGGLGRHPSHLMLTMAADALDIMGIRLEIKDVASQGEMYSKVMNGEADLWCGAQYGDVLPKLSGRFMSGGAENYFGLGTDNTDRLIEFAERTAGHKAYADAFAAILGNAVIVPVYQRKQYVIYGEALDENSIPEGLTAHYSYLDILHRITIKSGG